jgi:1H-pyrrole-2-carbonyl-[peptidyl-carrier protein] brominase
MRERYDVVVVGGGPSGSSTAFLLARQGLTTLVLERDEFPRYHIGESLTGTAGDFFTRNGFDEALTQQGFLRKPGTRFFGRDAINEFYVPVLRPTWQVRRAELDDLLLRHAKSCGVEHLKAVAQDVLRDGERVVGVKVRGDDGEAREIRASFLVDASGQAGFLSRLGVAGPRRIQGFNRQMAVYSQYTDVVRDTGELENCTILFYRDTYYWSWFIPLSATLVSIGVVLPISSFKLRGESLEAMLQWGFEHLNPELTRRVASARQVEEARASRNYSYRVDPFVGPGWLCVGDAHRFTDPIMSFGVSLGLSEAQLACDAIRAALDHRAAEERIMAGYAALCSRGQDRASELIRYFWKFPPFFAYMAKGSHKQDILHLLAGDFFTEQPFPASVEMRKSIDECPVLDRLPEGTPREIARAVYERFDFFQGVDAAFLELEGAVVRIHLLLMESDVDLYTALSEFEEELIAEFGRENLALLSYTPDIMDVAPPLEPMVPIFDRRPR